MKNFVRAKLSREGCPQLLSGFLQIVVPRRVIIKVILIMIPGFSIRI